MIDAHCHLTVYGDQIDRVLTDIQDNNMIVVAVSSDFDTFHETQELAKKSDCIIPGFGIHPKVSQSYLNQTEEISVQVENAGLIGEIGLDSKTAFDESRWNAQKQIFEEILKEACACDKVVNVHCEGAEKEVFSLLGQYDPAGVILHGYEGSPDLLNQAIDNEYMISIGRNILQEYKSRTPLWNRIREIAQNTPYDLLLVESDVPMVNPLKLPSELISELIGELSILRRETKSEIIAQTRRNLRETLSSDRDLDRFCSKLRLNNRGES